jgi:crotonobetainyl-CoA:carnitine CoA-transferase CaiB-like acyl-CoA transferase
LSPVATYQGLKVLDLSTNIAGPTAAMILGDLGADVIKIERPPGGDDTRSLPPKWNGEATVFLAMNRNKRSLVLDMRGEEGRRALLRLAATADVVVESFPPGVAAKLRLTAADFHAVNPTLILCTISAFGDGPIGSTMPGYDALVQAVSGMMSFTGHAGDPPVRLAPSVLDFSTGMWAAIAIQAALARRARSGAGDHLHAALIDTAFALMGHQSLGYLATGDLPEKLGSGAPSAAPYRVYAASDGHLMIATASDPQYPRLMAALGLKTESRFAAMADRIAGRDALDALIAGEVLKRPVAEWLGILGCAGISAGRVNNLAEALAMPVSAERRPFIDTDGVKVPRLPPDPAGEAVRRPPPKLGEHSREVLEEAGFSAEEIGRLL